METKKNQCGGMEERLAELLLDPQSVPVHVQEHVRGCAGCRGELEELRATMNLLDAWEAPEPSPYFMTRIEARLREERAAEPAFGPARWLARLRDSLSFAPTAHVRPVAAMAMTIVLLVGGGTYLGVANWDQEPMAQGPAAAAVHDLQTMDNNAQLLDQLETLSSNNENGD
jgi:hypothetical protein